MNKTLTVSTLILALIGGFFIFYNPKTSPVPDQNNSSIDDIAQNLESKTDEQASITVTITPVDISPESKEWKFDVGMSTHSVELDQDMIKVTVLVDDSGKEYKPLVWEGPTGGHHREGVLIFNKVTPTQKSITLKISSIGDVNRSFNWQLK